MVRIGVRILASGLCLLGIVGCASGDDARQRTWARGEVTIDGRHYAVGDAALEVEPGDEGYYTLHADPAPAGEDCLAGLAGGMALYGPLPPSVKRIEDLVGKRLPVEFSGDGDDANLCFVGTEGLLGARDAWVTIEAVDGDRARFSMSGEFERYDEGKQASTLLASARGTARIVGTP
jgi:hypothetical protein